MQDCARYVEEMTRLRREIHRRPEEGWTEFETQWKVFRALEALGWTIRMGLDVVRPEAVMGRNAELVEKAMVRAAEHGVPESFLKATGGYTGLTANFDTGREGPVTGFRFDMDCVLVEELHDASHLPAAEGFDSEIPGHMHACGHDAHTATGVTLAHWITSSRGASASSSSPPKKGRAARRPWPPQASWTISTGSSAPMWAATAGSARRPS